jgi:hypothetical protein
MRIKLLTCLLGLAIVMPCPSQSLRGRVMASDGSVPIAYALVELRDTSGTVIRRTQTAPSGTYQLTAPADGTYLLRFAAIGFTPTTSTVITLRSDTPLERDVSLEAVARVLADVLTRRGGRQCGREVRDDPLLQRILAGAQTSLRVVEAALGSGVRHSVREIRTSALGVGRSQQVQVDTLMRIATAWPLRSAPIDSLRAHGFARPFRSEDGPGRVYFAPDLHVLFSDWFLDSHCYTLSAADANRVQMDFEPAGRGRGVGIMGAMLLDGQSLALLELSYRYRNLPNHIPADAAGGDIQFRPVGTGGWLPVSWRIYAPIERIQRVVQEQRAGVRELPLGQLQRPAVLGSEEVRWRLISPVGP